MLVPNNKIAQTLLRKGKFWESPNTEARVSAVLKYLTNRVVSCPDEHKIGFQAGIACVCDTIVRKNNSATQKSRSKRMAENYRDDLVLEAFMTYLRLELDQPIPNLATAFSDGLPQSALVELQRFIKAKGSNAITPM